MSFWSNTNNPEPLRQFRWYIIFGEIGRNPPDLDFNLDSHFYALKECSKPSYKADVSSHVLLNHTFNFPKNIVWSPVKVKMASVVDEKNLSLGAIFEYLLRTGGYITPDKEENINKLSKGGFSFQQITIVQIDEEKNPIETWYMYNCMITNVNYGNLSYNSEDIVEIDFDIIYDYAVLEPNGYIRKKLDNVDRLEKEKKALMDSIGETKTPPLTQVLGGEPEGTGVTAEIGGKTIKMSSLPE